MAAQTDSPERIAADILIAAIQTASDVNQKKDLCTPANAAKYFQTIFNTVINARDNTDED
ncbi:hypothetical protein [Marinobacter sp. KMM 10035]|uniref:hypothetical protein n=1 Tax=Marinobacter sp. KMM 10035 TaxID=3134034 RepID=UPI003979832E